MQVKLLNAAALLLSLYNGLFSQESRQYGTEGLLEGMEDFILTDMYTELLYCNLSCEVSCVAYFVIFHIYLNVAGKSNSTYVNSSLVYKG